MSVIWQGEPAFSEDDLQGATRYKIGDYYVDWNEEGEPTLEIIKERLGLTPSQQFKTISSQFEAVIQKHLDSQAQLLGYDDILSACTYAFPNNPFQAEATSFVVWRSAVWAYCYQELEKVHAGTRPMPTIEEIIGELPQRVV